MITLRTSPEHARVTADALNRAFREVFEEAPVADALNAVARELRSAIRKGPIVEVVFHEDYREMVSAAISYAALKTENDDPHAGVLREIAHEVRTVPSH